MAEVDLDRLVLPALLALLLLGAFTIVVTAGGTPTVTNPTPVSKSDPASRRVTPAVAKAAQAAPKAPQAAPKAPQTAAPASSASPRFAKVQEGDTADSIAARAGISADRLADLNPSVDTGALRPGQTLKLAP